MARIAIISSYKEDCGIAFYAERLKNNFERYKQHQVTMISLDLTLLKNLNPYFVRAGNQHIDIIAKSLSSYDAVILQYEPGLYANTLSLSQKRVLKLLTSHHNVLLTLHCHLLNNEISHRKYLKELVTGKIKTALKTWLCLKQERNTNRFWYQIASLGYVKIHTHCQQDKNILKEFYRVSHIFDFPHALFTQQEVTTYKTQYDRSAFLQRYNLNPAHKYIAIFGFYGAYKGHVTAIKMLQYLPEDYHLLIIGSEHPQGMQSGIQTNEYLEQILSVVEAPADNMRKATALTHRVHFLGHISNQDVPEFYSVIDYVVLPYFNPQGGQSGSGPAAHALEFNCRTLFSNAQVFRYLEKYFTGAMKLCNVGNYIEFAQNILRYENFEGSIKQNLQQAFSHYNPETFIELYEQALGLVK